MHTKLLTIESLAAMLDVSQRTVQREIDACGLLWMTAEWRQGKADAAYKALLEAAGRLLDGMLHDEYPEDAK